MMYAEHFGLAAEAFALTPDPGFFYSGPDHMEALAGVKLMIEAQRGLAVVVGEVGTGKTTLLYNLLSDLGPSVRTAYLSNSRLSFAELLRLALADFGAPCEGRDKADLLQALNRFLRGCASEGATAALVIDEAQNLELDVFEDLRLLSNFETYDAKLLQIVLVGQPELEDKLADPRLRQVADRIAVHCRIEPLGREDAATYVAHRIACAGGTSDLFTPAAIRLVVRASGGFPRRINMLCHDALLFAFARGERRVSAAAMRSAIGQRTRLGGARRRDRRGSLAARPLLFAACAAAVIGGAWLWHAPEQSPSVAVAATGVTDVAPRTVPGDAPVPVAETVAPDPDRDAVPVTTAVASPDLARADVAPARSPAVSTTRAVRVTPGMTLTALARQFYGNEHLTTIDGISRANPSLANPDVLPVGTTLSLPTLAGDSARKEPTNE
jgi:type II secretory pathway predicted ATPase ExeA/phage tail protein X